jgi:ATP-binding cassette subfamily C protein
MRFLFAIFRQYPWQTIAMLALMLLSGIFEGVGLSAMLPLLTIALGSFKVGTMGAEQKVTAAEQMVRSIFDGLGISPTLEFLIIMIFIAILLKTVLALIANKRVGYTVAQVTADLRHQTLRAFILARWEFHLTQPVGKLTAALGNETARAARAYAAGVSLIVAAIHAIIYVSVALLVSWRATLIALAAGTLFWYPLNRFVKKAKKAGNRQIKVRRSLSSFFVDTILSLKSLKAMAREDRAEGILIYKTDKLKNTLKKEVINKLSLSAYQEGMTVTFSLIAIYIAIVIGGMAPETVLILIVLLRRILTKLGKVQKQYQVMGIQEAGYWSMTEIVEKARKVREKHFGNQKPTLERSVRLEGVTFDYSKGKLFNDLSLVFPAGEITAIVGPSGSGKTTIVDLIIGLLRPQKGEVWIDDLPLVQVDLHQWRRMIGYVPQETLLLDDSVFINVTLGDPDITEKEVQEALRKAEVWDFVETLPKGVYSSVGQRGLRMSGGQRQRLAIARALTLKPKLLVLDEATTALDPKTEADICETLRMLRGELTILAISHQPAILNIADWSYRLESGKAVIISDQIAHSNAEKDASSIFI